MGEGAEDGVVGGVMYPMEMFGLPCAWFILTGRGREWYFGECGVGA